jgi:hypothetical protein
MKKKVTVNSFFREVHFIVILEIKDNWTAYYNAPRKQDRQVSGNKLEWEHEKAKKIYA